MNIDSAADTRSAWDIGPPSRRRTQVLAASAAALALILSGCGGSGSADTSADTSTDTTAAAANGVAAAGAAAPAADQDARGYDDSVVSTEWLEEHLDDENLRIIEVSVDPGVYERSHIPGAVNVVWHTDLVDTTTRDIVDRDGFQELVRSAGVDDDSTVVIYGDTNNWFSAWGAWIFEIYGVEDVRLLDGGRVAWEAEGRPLDIAQPVVAAGSYTAPEPNLALRARLPDVLDIATGGTEAALVDIRSADEYNGVIFAPEGFQELAVRAGHIPTAVNVPWGQAVTEDGRFKPVEELRALYAEAGVDGSAPVVVYCRIGERAAHTWFVLHHLLGYDVSLYDGSWTEYGNAVGVPIDNPSGTVWGGT